MTLQFEIFDRCDAVKKDGTTCQQAFGHSGNHCATGFDYLGLDEDEEPIYDLYPIYWKDEDNVTT